MNYRETEDAEVKAALRRFRESVHDWSDREYSKPRLVQRSRWSGFWGALSNPVMGWSLASALVLASVGVPVTVHHEHQVAAEHKLALEQQQKRVAEEARLQAAAKISDEELLAHVDDDIAQAAPDAMQPLASLMSDSTGE